MVIERSALPSSQRRSWPPGFWPVVALLVFVGSTGPNLVLALLSVVGLLLGVSWLWRPGEPPVLLFIFAYQWTQACIAVFHANALGLSIDNMGLYGGDTWTASVLSLGACISIAAGMRLGAGRRLATQAVSQANLRQNVSIRRWFNLYLLALAAAFFLQSFSWAIPGLRQIFLALAGLKWAFFWMLAYVAFRQWKVGKRYFLLAFGVEFVLAFGGYFSSFKSVFIFSLLALVASGYRLSGRQKAGIAGLVLIVLLLGSVWSAIKVEYRQFVSGGTGQQVVLVGPAERVTKLAELVGGLGLDKLADGWDRMLQRMTYVEFFGVVLQRVPAVVPHTGGALWVDAVRRPLMPRLFFPGKSAVDDSALVNRMTGLGVAGAAQGTSISLGVPAETYIDFGPWAMFVPLFTLGWACGRLYRFYLTSPRTRGPLGMGLAVAVLYPLALMETSILKLIASLMLGALASLLVVRFIVPRYIRWLVPVYSRQGTQ